MTEIKSKGSGSIKEILMSGYGGLLGKVQLMY